MKQLLTIGILCLLCLTVCAQHVPENEAATKALKSYLQRNFADQDIPWYEAIRAVSVRGDIAVAITSVVYGDQGAVGVCRGLSGYVFAKDNPFAELKKVLVLDTDGKVLIYRQKLSDPCKLNN